MFGADAARVAETGRRFLEASTQLENNRASLNDLFDGTVWAGADAFDSRHEWQSSIAPALVRASVFTTELGMRLLRHADEQFVASSADVGAASLAGGGVGARVRAIQGFGPGGAGVDLVDLDEYVREIIDRLKKLWGDDPGSGGATEQPGRGRVAFDGPPDGRRAIVAAMTGLADGDRIRRDEIEVRVLDNGRYVVVLPGVVDLSQGVEEFVDRVRSDGVREIYEAGSDTYNEWHDNDEPTVRKMRYAIEAARHDDVSENPYATVVALALEDAGVPAGADVMLVGHSFGAYTAVDLAVGPFNTSSTGHAPRDGSYGVNVTHVVAAGAEIDWRFDELPPTTDVLVVNNRFDMVYRAEDVLHGNGEAMHPNHLERSFWGGLSGWGHDEEHYIEHLAGTGDDDVARWLGGADAYASPGTRFSVKVLDPNR